MRAAVVVALSLLGPLGFAEELPPAPLAGVDADFQSALDLARADLASGRPARAAQTVRRLLLETDRFATAQRDVFQHDSEQLLEAAGRALQAAGDHAGAAVAFDAAWTIAGRTPSPETAAALVQLSDERPDRNEKLWLLRRAVEADPSNAHARALDRHYSTNSLRIPATTITLLGTAGLLTGIVMVADGGHDGSALAGSLHDRMRADELLHDRNRLFLGGGIALGIGAAACITGGVLYWLGQPSGQPRSPSILPALPERP